MTSPDKVAASRYAEPQHIWWCPVNEQWQGYECGDGEHGDEDDAHAEGDPPDEAWHGYYPGTLAALRAERDEARKAVSFLYEKWENGTPCNDDFDEDGRACGASMGNAFTMSVKEEDSVLAVLERAEPGTTVLATPEARETVTTLRAERDALLAERDAANRRVRWACEWVRRLSDQDGATLSLDADDWDDIKNLLTHSGKVAT